MQLTEEYRLLLEKTINKLLEKELSCRLSGYYYLARNALDEAKYLSKRLDLLIRPKKWWEFWRWHSIHNNTYQTF